MLEGERMKGYKSVVQRGWRALESSQYPFHCFVLNKCMWEKGD